MTWNNNDNLYKIDISKMYDPDLRKALDGHIKSIRNILEEWGHPNVHIYGSDSEYAFDLKLHIDGGDEDEER